MSHWSEKYVGKPYHDGEYDCAIMTLEIEMNEFGRLIDLPKDRVLNSDGSPNWRGISNQIEKNKYSYAEKTNSPVDGDVVLMIGRGRLNHIGVFCVIDGINYVLHNIRNVGSVCLHKINDLSRFNLQVEGYYKFIKKKKK